MSQPRVEVSQDADAECPERARNLWACGEAKAAEVVDDVACKGDDDHDGHLAPLGLVEDADAEDEEGDEDEAVEAGEGVVAGGLGGGVGVEEAVESGADGDAETEEEGVDDGVDDADGTGDEGTGLEFKGGAY